MKHPSLVRTALAAGLLLLVAACSAEQKELAQPSPLAREAELPVLGPAPAWQLRDFHGTVVSSEQFRGKVVVVDFWATWCGPCIMEIPGYIAMTKKYGEEGLVIVGISTDQAGPDVVQAFVRKHGMNYPVAMYNESVVNAFGGLDAIPTTFLIDRAGRIRDKKVGAEASADYEKKVLALLR